MGERRTAIRDRRLVSRGGRRLGDYSGRPTVLIVDDHVDSRELLAAVLQELGVTIAEAGTGREALDRAAASPRPDLILLDLGLPDCHGTDIVRALKGDDSTRGIPVVALSASVRAEDKHRAEAAGCAAFIEKPLLPADLVRFVRKLLAEAGV